MLHKKQEKLVIELSNKYCIPRLVIEVICNSPFLFTKQVMLDLDIRPIMFAYLGKIKLKKKVLEEIKKEKEE